MCLYVYVQHEGKKFIYEINKVKEERKLCAQPLWTVLLIDKGNVGTI